MDLLKAYKKDSRQGRKESRWHIVESRKGKKESRQYVVDSRKGKKESREHIVDSRKGKTKQSLSTSYFLLSTNKGVALLIALLMSVAIMALVAGVLYFITQSTTMSGAGKRYATAQEASDGAVEAMKNSIYLVFHGNAAPNVFTDTGNCLTTAIQQCTGQNPCQGTTCNVTVNLPGLGGSYNAAVTVQRLYTVSIPGGRLEFAKSAGGAPSTAIFYRITTSVTGPDNTTADSSALYRLTD